MKRETDRPESHWSHSTPNGGALASALTEPLDFVQENLRAVEYVMARIGDLLPPQIDEDEIVSYLVLRLADAALDPEAQHDIDGWLWQQALAYLRQHPVVKAASRWLHASVDPEKLSSDQLREIALALTVYGDRWLPGNDPYGEEVLARALTKLPTDERLALAMYYFEGLTLPEIAEILDIAPDEVSALYASAMRKLRQAVVIAAAELAEEEGTNVLPRAA